MNLKRVLALQDDDCTSNDVQLSRLIVFARRLGLEIDEVIRRVRWEIAGLSYVFETPAHARGRASVLTAKQTPEAIDHALDRREEGYTTARRAELRRALDIVAEIYGRNRW